MKYLFRFLLALVMATLLVVTSGSRATVGNKHSIAQRVENMASQPSNNSNKVKQDGLQIEITEPQIVALSIPENKPGATAPLSFTVSVTNPTQASIPFVAHGALIPEIRTPDGRLLPRKEPINRQAGNGEYSGTLIEAGQEIVTSVDGMLSWQNNLLQLILHDPSYYGAPIELDKSWSFDTLEPGEYQLRFVYKNPTGTILYPDITFIQTRQDRRIEVTGTGELTTSFANFRLLQPVEDNKNAVEVDGIRFETFIPEPLLTVQNKRRNTGDSVQIGMRITNNTPTPFYFSFYGTFTPDLVTPDGQLLRGGYESDWMRWWFEKSDFLFAEPGKSVTFFPEISLSWSERDQFSLYVSNDYGGVCSFGKLKPDIYQIRFRYQSTIDPTQKTDFAGEPLQDWLIEIMQKVWNGRVDTPFAEFRLSQS